MMVTTNQITPAVAKKNVINDETLAFQSSITLHMHHQTLLLNAMMNLTMVPFHLSNLTTLLYQNADSVLIKKSPCPIIKKALLLTSVYMAKRSKQILISLMEADPRPFTEQFLSLFNEIPNSPLHLFILLSLLIIINSISETTTVHMFDENQIFTMNKDLPWMFQILKYHHQYLLCVKK